MLELRDVALSLPDLNRKPPFGKAPMVDILRNINVDLAPGDQKAEYVALSNTIIGILLLLLGALVGVLLAFSFELPIAVLSVFALLGAAITLTMKNVQD